MQLVSFSVFEYDIIIFPVQLYTQAACFVLISSSWLHYFHYQLLHFTFNLKFTVKYFILVEFLWPYAN